MVVIAVGVGGEALTGLSVLAAEGRYGVDRGRRSWEIVAVRTGHAGGQECAMDDDNDAVFAARPALVNWRGPRGVSALQSLQVGAVDGGAGPDQASPAPSSASGNSYRCHMQVSIPEPKQSCCGRDSYRILCTARTGACIYSAPVTLFTSGIAVASLHYRGSSGPTSHGLCFIAADRHAPPHPADTNQNCPYASPTLSRRCRPPRRSQN